MNTTEKYYTPTIEEFHVGFEFEKFLNVEFAGDDSGWHPTKFSIYKDHEDIEDAIEKNIGEFDNIDIEQVRVKYLDQSDIESLGWKFIGIGNVSRPSPFKNFSLNDYWLEFYFDDDQHIQITSSCNKPNEDHEFGPLHLKNKSELRKFMKQANISAS